MPEKRPSDYRAQWDALAREAAALEASGKPVRGLTPDDTRVREHEARVAALVVSQDAVAHDAWEATARDFDDVLILAEIAWVYWWGIGAFPQMPTDIDGREQREVAIAYLVRGVWNARIVQQSDNGGTQP
jgi:hypothetical protein